MTTPRHDTGHLLLSRRGFLIAAAGGLGAGYIAYRSMRTPMPTSDARARIVVVGAGPAGLGVASRLRGALKNAEITIVDPSETHYYQPGFTLVAAGVFDAGHVVRPQAGLIPDGVRWVKDSAVDIDPEAKRVVTAANGAIDYDFLVLCPGLRMDFGAIEGIDRQSLGAGNVHCIYDYQSAQKCWQAIQKLPQDGGRAIFTDTWTKLKCGGAPKKINLIAEHHCRLKGGRDKVDFQFISATDHLFEVQPFRKRMEDIFAERKIPFTINHRVHSVDTQARKVTFMKHTKTADGETKEPVVMDFSFLHIVPPMSVPDFVKKSALAVDPKTGKVADWVPVNKATMVHARYKNVITLGDVSGLPTSKTGAAIRMQAPLAAANMVELVDGKAPSHHYDGYTACPLVTEYGKVLMAEFDYDKKPKPTLPLLDPGREHWAGWALKVHVLPPLYFNAILKGRA